MFGWGSGSDAVDQSRGSFSGYLWKMKKIKKTVVPQWAKRWYSIEGRHLRWYNSPTSELSGEIELADVSGVSRFESGEKGVFSFMVACPDRNLLLRASSAAEMKMWVRALQMQANLANGGNGMGILCKGKGQGNDMSSASLQKKLRSSSLESELNRKMVELDNLERSIESPGKSKLITVPDSDLKNKNKEGMESSSKRQEYKFHYVVGEETKEPSKRSTRQSSSHRTDEVPSTSWRNKAKKSKLKNDYDNDDHLDADEPAQSLYDREPEVEEADEVQVRRPYSRNSRRSSEYQDDIIYKEEPMSSKKKHAFTPKSIETRERDSRRSSRTAWI